MLLNREFRREFDWRGKRLRVGFLLPESRTKISAGLAFMSKESIRHRFFGIKNGFSEKELKHLTEIDGYHHFALGLEEVDAPERGIGVMRMVRNDLHHEEAELALLLIDDYQRQGLGEFFIKLGLIAAKERGITTLRFTFLPDNEGIRRLIKKFGTPEQEQTAYDEVTFKLKLGAELADAAQKDLQFLD